MNRNPLDLTAAKLTVSILLSTELADDIRESGNLFDAIMAEQRRLASLTPQQRAHETAERTRVNTERKAAEQAQASARQAAAMARVAPALRPILELHGPSFDSWYGGAVCDGCDGEGYERESPAWPCRTWELAVSE